MSHQKYFSKLLYLEFRIRISQNRSLSTKSGDINRAELSSLYNISRSSFPPNQFRFLFLQFLPETIHSSTWFLAEYSESINNIKINVRKIA